ncbi:GPI transamidase component PIG-T [Haematococcus lacustris]|uniref:GPI transamidase component PIG-T n=1 Tax=Haematococcus lacustris TaxID=44745 RepID=A0A699YMS3_HAELA|nr:GPI transamidase component PIG-T [Haematococcus lacustris]
MSKGPAGPWEAVLPQEPVCTDNLTPWLKLLPCGSKAGVAQLMSSRATIFSSCRCVKVEGTGSLALAFYHHSLSLVLEVQRQPRPSGVQPPTSLLRLRHRLTLVLPSELVAPAGAPPVVACIKQMLPWQIQLWLHTLQLTVDGQVIDSSGMQLRLQPAAHRTAPSALNLCFTLPANCTSLTLSAAFSKAFLTVSQQPPDAHRGVDVPAALLSLQAPDVDETQVVSTGVLVQLATPDISMGYNVICLSSTVMAVYVGAVLTALTKRMDQVHSAPAAKPELDSSKPTRPEGWKPKPGQA